MIERSSKKIMEQVENDNNDLPELPSEVWMHIISRLPLTTICQVRCVSKTWCSLISGSGCSSTNIFHAKSLATNLVILGNKTGSSRNLYMAKFSVTRDYTLAGAGTNIEVYDLGCEYGPVASCNGLVLLIAYLDVNPITYCVSNPIIGQYMKLPFPKDIEGRRYFCGFGFCPSTKEYKVIQFHSQRGEDTVVEVHVLGTYTWRRTQVIPPEYLDNHVRTCISIGTYLNGALYWMVLKGEDVVIYCFDLEHEQFSTISGPKFKVSGGVKFLGEKGGHLYLSVKCSSVLEVWLMKNFESTSSWRKELSISIPQMDERFHERAIEIVNYADGTNVIILGCYDAESLKFYLVAWNLKVDCENVVGVKVLRSRYRPFAYIPDFTSLSDVVAGDTYQLKFGYLSKKNRSSYRRSKQAKFSI